MITDYFMQLQLVPAFGQWRSARSVILCIYCGLVV